ncbi:MAG: glycosyltransferase family 1 protein [Candidatus Zixiibacteriota bacterium]
MTGLGNYSRTIIHSLAARFPQHRYLLYTPAWKDNPRLEFLRSCDNVEIKLPQGIYSGALKDIWRSYGVRSSLKNDQLDIFHGLSNELPFGSNRLKCAKVVTIHDLIFLRYPQYYPWLDRKIYRLKSRYACRVADSIIAVSEQTKRDIIEYYAIPAEKIRVIYQSCDPSFTRSVSENDKSSVRARYNLPSQFVLYVGMIEERKNLLALVKAIETLHKSHDLSLVAIGGGGEYKELVNRYIQSAGLADRVQLRTDIAFSDFPAIYQMALAFVYPSHFEGFGIPIIEALWSKTPVITSKGGCFPEAAGPAGVYISPHDHYEIADALKRVIGDSNLRAKMIAGGFSHVQKFREDSVSAQMLDLYQSLVRS